MLFKQSYTDNIILEQIRHLNKDALSYLYEHNFISVHNYITGHGGTEADVREELSGAVINLWQKVNKENFNPDIPLEKVIFNNVRENFHKHQLQKSQKHAVTTKPEDDQKERVKHLYEVLDRQSQEVLHLHYFEGWDLKRIEEKYKLKTTGEAEEMIRNARMKLEQIINIILS